MILLSCYWPLNFEALGHGFEASLRAVALSQVFSVNSLAPAEAAPGSHSKAPAFGAKILPPNKAVQSKGNSGKDSTI